jgi:hypothetical protein
MARPMTAAEWRTAMNKWGVQWREYPNWATRTRPGDFTDIRGVVIHHTGSDIQSDNYLKWLFTVGRASEGIPAPLCHVSTDMDGDVWVGAIGRANHAGKGSSSTLNAVTAENYRGFSAEIGPGPDDTDGNAHFYGNEVRYDGGQPMTDKQHTSAVRWAAAICDHYGWSALSVIGHREWSSRKNDPGLCPMTKFRADVAALLKAGPPTKPAPTPTATTGGSMAIQDTTEYKAAYQANVDYNRALWGEGGTAGEFQQRTDARILDVVNRLEDIKNRLIRIEADTDKAATIPTISGTTAEPKPA